MILFSIFLTAIALVLIPIVTIVIGTLCMLAAVLRFEDRPGSPYDVLPRAWAKALVAIGGVRVTVHNPERAGDGTPHIFLANHVSWYDIPALGSFLPRAKFVAKAELFKIPVLGGAMRAVGMVPIERHNRKAAFGAYDEASQRIREGDSVIVFPEGSRGYDYPLRPFKKGPFVLAIDAGVPIVPVLLFGTREVIRKGSMLLHPHRVDVHLLEPVSIEGYGYDDRDLLAVKVRSRIAEALASHYGIESPPQRAAPASTENSSTT